MISFLLLVSAEADARYSDTVGHWAESAISRWSERSVLNGRGDGIFDPDGQITRGEMAKIIDCIMKYRTEADNVFDDLEPSDWYIGHILRLFNSGVMKGNGSSAMGAMPITRQDAVVMLVRAFDIEISELTEDSFADYNEIANLDPQYARGAVGAMVSRGYIKGYSIDGESYFKPLSSISRAELVAILDRMISDMIVKPGSYSGSYDGILLVNTGGVVLRDSKVTGTLFLSDGAAGNESVAQSLDHASLQGSNTLELHNSEVNELCIKSDGASMLVSRGASVGSITIDASSVSISGDGTVTSVDVVSGEGSAVYIEGATVSVSENAGPVTIINGTISTGQTEIVTVEKLSARAAYSADSPVANTHITVSLPDDLTDTALYLSNNPTGGSVPEQYDVITRSEYQTISSDCDVQRAPGVYALVAVDAGLAVRRSTTLEIESGDIKAEIKVSNTADVTKYWVDGSEQKHDGKASLSISIPAAEETIALIFRNSKNKEFSEGIEVQSGKYSYSLVIVWPEFTPALVETARISTELDPNIATNSGDCSLSVIDGEAEDIYISKTAAGDEKTKAYVEAAEVGDTVESAYFTKCSSGRWENAVSGDYYAAEVQDGKLAYISPVTVSEDDIAESAKLSADDEITPTHYRLNGKKVELSGTEGLIIPQTAESVELYHEGGVGYFYQKVSVQNGVLAPAASKWTYVIEDIADLKISYTPNVYNGDVILISQGIAIPEASLYYSTSLGTGGLSDQLMSYKDGCWYLKDLTEAKAFRNDLPITVNFGYSAIIIVDSNGKVLDMYVHYQQKAG